VGVLNDGSCITFFGDETDFEYSLLIKPSVGLKNTTTGAITVKKLFFALDSNPGDGLVIDIGVYHATTHNDPLNLKTTI
jgi:hypothetical protein